MRTLNNRWKTLIIEIFLSISKWIRFLCKTQFRYCQQWWDPNKEHQLLCILFLLNGGVNHHFSILFSYWFSITTTRKAIFTWQKIQNCKSVPFFINWGSFSKREKRLYAIHTSTQNFYAFLPWTWTDAQASPYHPSHPWPFVKALTFIGTLVAPVLPSLCRCVGSCPAWGYCRQELTLFVGKSLGTSGQHLRVEAGPSPVAVAARPIAALPCCQVHGKLPEKGVTLAGFHMT